jgi:hypothetical protein
LPIVAIPTTAGTGSEATRFTIVTDEANDEKMLCIGLAYLPVAALVDYELTLTKPKRLTADTGIDALTHAIEAYVSRRSNIFSDGLALQAMGLIAPNLRRVWTDPGDRAAREAILRQENLWLMFGGPTGSKIYGVLSPENQIPKTNSAHWSTLSETQNLKLIADKVALISATGIEVPTHIYMGIAQYIYYATTMFPDTQKSLLAILLENLKPLGIQEIVQVPELSYNAALKTALLAKKYDNETATRYAGGVDGKDAMLILSRNPAKIAGIVGQDVKSLAPEVRSAVTTVTLVMSSGGVEARYPNAHHIVTFNAAP